MNKFILITIVLILSLLFGCTTTGDIKNSDTSQLGKRVQTFCEDGVICYDVLDIFYNTSSGSCFRDKDLIEKYCKKPTQPFQ